MWPFAPAAHASAVGRRRGPGWEEVCGLGGLRGTTRGRGQRAGLPGPPARRRMGPEALPQVPRLRPFPSVTLRGPCQCPPPPDPPTQEELQTRHFGAARKTRVAGPRRGESQTSEGNCRTQKVGRALLRQKWTDEGMLRGQRRRCPIKANGSGVKPSIVRPHAGTGGCKRCAELLVCCKGAVRTTGDTATRGSEGRVESRRRGRCRVCPCVWGDGDTNELARFSRNGEVSVPTAAVGHCSTPLHHRGPSHRPDSTAHRPRPACVPES